MARSWMPWLLDQVCNLTKGNFSIFCWRNFLLLNLESQKGLLHNHCQWGWFNSSARLMWEFGAYFSALPSELSRALSPCPVLTLRMKVYTVLKCRDFYFGKSSLHYFSTHSFPNCWDFLTFVFPLEQSREVSSLPGLSEIPSRAQVPQQLCSATASKTMIGLAKPISGVPAFCEVSPGTSKGFMGHRRKVVQMFSFLRHFIFTRMAGSKKKQQIQRIAVLIKYDTFKTRGLQLHNAG